MCRRRAKIFGSSLSLRDARHRRLRAQQLGPLEQRKELGLVLACKHTFNEVDGHGSGKIEARKRAPARRRICLTGLAVVCLAELAL